jgi:hypothetical protein
MSNKTQISSIRQSQFTVEQQHEIKALSFEGLDFDGPLPRQAWWLMAYALRGRADWIMEGDARESWVTPLRHTINAILERLECEIDDLKSLTIRRNTNV